MSEAHRAALLAEKNWTLQEHLPPLPKGQPEAIGLGHMVCPTCNGRKTVTLPVKGDTNGVMAMWEVDCYCEDFEPFFRRWNAMVPMAYRGFRLDSLSTSSASRVPAGVQSSLIADLKANPDQSYLIVGPPATSKTVYSTCLFEHALKNWIEQRRDTVGPDACWFVSAFDLLQQAHDYAIQREMTYIDESGHVNRCPATEPLVTVSKIRRAVAAGLRPHLFVEELDKIPTVTEFRGSTIFELIKEVDAQCGQIVVTANKSFAELEQMYAIRDGGALMRRFTKGNSTGDGKTLDLFKFV